MIEFKAAGSPKGWLIKDVFDADPEAWFYTAHEDQAREYAQDGAPVYAIAGVIGALEQIADEAPYRSGYCQSDVEYEPKLSVDEMQKAAREALSGWKAA